MDTATLKEILLEELQGYTCEGLNDFAYLTTNEAQQIYTILDIAQVRDKRRRHSAGSAPGGQPDSH